MAATLDTRPALDADAPEWELDLPVEYKSEAFSVDGESEQASSLWDDSQRAGIVTPGGQFVNVDQECMRMQQAVDTKNLAVSWVIVSRSKVRNRNGNMVQIKEGGGHPGLDTTFHQRSPIVLFNHGFPDPNPIALTKTPDSGKYTVKKQARRAMAVTYFLRRKTEDPESETQREFVTETAETTFALIEAEAMNANSISYVPYLARRLKDDDLSTSDEDGVESLQWWGGWDFVHTELIEDSIVPIGADRDALRQFLDRRSVHGAKIRGDYAKVLQSFVGQQPAMMGYHANLRPIGDLYELPASQPVVMQETVLKIKGGGTMRITEPAVDLAADDPTIIVTESVTQPVAPTQEQQAADMLDEFTDALEQSSAEPTDEQLLRLAQEAVTPLQADLKRSADRLSELGHTAAKVASRASGQF